MSSVLLFIGIISFLVIIHELGHFFAAKKVGVKVEEFGLGLPPKLFGKKFGGTLFSFNALPFGGFVRLKGEEVEDSGVDSFESKTPYQRAFIVLAGVLTNLVFAVILLQVILFYRDFKTDYFPVIADIKPSFGKVETTSGLIAGVLPESKLDREQIKSGDYVYSVNQVVVTSNEQLKENVTNTQGETANIVIKNLRDRSIVKEISAPLIQKDGKNYLGIYLGEAGRVTFEGNSRYYAGVLQSMNVIEQSYKAMGMLINQSIKNNDPSIVTNNVEGPIGIYSVVNTINQNNKSVINLEILDLVATLSLSLAIMNILPIPAVDGGRLVFIVYEMIRKKRVHPNFELAVNKYGMLFLLGLLIIVTFKDITHLFGN
jgi:regulator of sigma E protease